MKNKWILVGAMAVAFLAGRYLLPAPTSGLTGISAEETPNSSDREESRRLAGSRSGRRAISDRSGSASRGANASDVATGMYWDLVNPDPIESHRQAFERFEEVNASNWKEVFEQFSRVTSETGITNDELWNKMLVRIGQVAGEEAMNQWVGENPMGHQAQAQQTMWGWAMKDPQGAASWYRAQDTLDPQMRQALLSRLVSGMALATPEKLFAFAETLSPEEQRHSLGHSVWGLMRGGGVAQTSRWLEQVQSSDWSETVKAQSFNQVASSVSRIMRGGAGMDLASDWFTRFGQSPHLTSAHVENALQNVRTECSVQGLDFLKKMSDLPALADQRRNPPGMLTLITKAVTHDPARLEEWLNQNEGVPFHAMAVQQYARVLEEAGEIRQGQ